ncbi:hypothetical protein [Methylobacterium indicum]|uniref:hypothetical protein n=1 Tax=Methylobacterium indicum TaxID=1775910 RepID=UPI000A4CC190|nr:hypothetical protein [Methylobacterium indicum]
MSGLEDRLLPETTRSWYLTKIAFNRDYTKARPLEMKAFKVIERAFLDEFGGTEPENFKSKLKISSHFLEQSSSDEKNLSTFFQYVDIGGSGSTIYTVLAFKNIKDSYFSYALKINTSEAGGIYLTRDYGETGHKLVVVKDRHIYAEYIQNDGHYIGNTAE